MTGNQGVFDVYAEGRKMELKNSFARETWNVTQADAHVLVRDADGQAMVVEAPHGKGHAVLSGLSLGNMTSQQTSISDDFHREGVEQTNAGASELILQVARLAGVAALVEVPSNIRVRHLVSDGHHILIAYEFQKTPTEGVLKFAAAGDSPWRNLLDGASGEFHDGGTALSFKPNEVKVLVF